MIIVIYLILSLALGEGSGGYSDGDQQSNEDFSKVKMNIDLSMEISGEANQISKYVLSFVFY